MLCGSRFVGGGECHAKQATDNVYHILPQREQEGAELLVPVASNVPPQVVIYFPSRPAALVWLFGPF